MDATAQEELKLERGKISTDLLIVSSLVRPEQKLCLQTKQSFAMYVQMSLV